MVWGRRPQIPTHKIFDFAGFPENLEIFQLVLASKSHLSSPSRTKPVVLFEAERLSVRPKNVAARLRSVASSSGSDDGAIAKW